MNAIHRVAYAPSIHTAPPATAPRRETIRMFRTLFSRLMTTYLSIYLLAVLLLGGLSLQLMAQQVQKETLTAMNDVAMEVNDLWQWNLYGGVSSAFMEQRVKDLAVRHDAVIWRVTSSPILPVMTVVSVGRMDGQLEPKDEEKARMQAVLDGTAMSEQGAFDLRFGEAVYTVGLPGGDGTHAVFVHRSLTLVQDAIRSLALRMGIAAALVLLLGVVLITVMSRRVTKPLRQMLSVVQAVGNGQFDRRVTARGRDEVAQLAREFNEMASDLQSLEDLRRDFVANVSHELKSPLTSIQGYVQGMHDGTIPPEETRRYMDIVLSETRRLSKLISELLDLSRLESGQLPLHIRDFDLNELVRRALLRFEGKIDERHMSVEVVFKQETCMAHADRDRIDQVITNLIDNAVKYGKDGGTISVWTHAAEDRVFVTIKDDGPGIDAGDLPYIFERFYKADKAHSGLGTGLGLSIVKKILEQHATNIEVQSRPGEGTSFLFSLERAGEKA